MNDTPPDPFPTDPTTNGAGEVLQPGVHLPPWAPPAAQAAARDLVSYIDTLDVAEVAGSLRCMVTDLTMTGMGPAVPHREHRIAVTAIVINTLLARLDNLTAVTATHNHCEGFTDVVINFATRVHDARPGGGS